MVRALWRTIENSTPTDQTTLKRKVSESINRLKAQIENSLNPSPTSRPSDERCVFDNSAEDVRRITVTTLPARFPKPVLRVYTKDLAKHALQHLPRIAHCQSVEEVRGYLVNNLRFNAQATRQRNAGYLINRFFPGSILNTDLPAFAAAVAGTPALGEALFYLTCRTEQILALAAEEVVFPSLAEGGVGRTRICEYIRARFPKSKSVNEVCGAVVATYLSFGIGSSTRTRLNVSLREGSLLAFAYVLHLEFPEPGMYAFERMFDGPMHKWMLWDQQWMVCQLYRLREVGLLSKVSEIDRLRQFTMKYTLADAVPHLVALARESPA